MLSAYSENQLTSCYLDSDYMQWMSGIPVRVGISISIRPRVDPTMRADRGWNFAGVRWRP